MRMAFFEALQYKNMLWQMLDFDFGEELVVYYRCSLAFEGARTWNNWTALDRCKNSLNINAIIVQAP